MSTPPGDDRDVISNLPRSRRQRPSARREAARAQRAGASAPAPAAKAPAKAKPKTTSKPRATAGRAPKPKVAAAATATTRTPRRSIPPAGYAAPQQAETRGNDPAAAITGLVRGVLKRLPF